MNEQYFEKLLNIKTSGTQKIFNESIHYNRYEPTSYEALNTLFEQYTINNSDSILDFGCGKGRLNFYIHYYFNASVTGIEMDNYFYHEAMENRADYFKKHKKNKSPINFSNSFAQEYNISHRDNKFYFFNPFSVQIFSKVVENILISLEKHERSVDIILYYPSEDYIYFLENKTSFTLSKEVILPNLYKHDNRERFLIYSLSL
ncbi:MAG: class I SAM-dependent methyltransferase [Clostridium sp.]|uniref:class I SAM-dependent methyltransferase n=1 Tax=Clostridium sp. TaxID=1506 RepID=UPI003F33D7AA